VKAISDQKPSNREMPPLKPHDRIIVALDFSTVEEARAIAGRLSGRVGMFKVGSQLFTAGGPPFVRELTGRGEKVFLDLKFHDIPNTVAGAVSAACQLGVSLLDVHALGGRAMMEAAVGALPAMGARLLAITILTSMDERAHGEVGLAGEVADSVRGLAALARETGLDGVVASPHEVPLIRQVCGPDFLVVTPGIRPAGAARGDQARAATPRAALDAGADLLVIGRPITAAPDPSRALDELLAEIA
jgi:orotidine-5'-phosphate decarboxylase